MRSIASYSLVTTAGAFAIGGVFTVLNTVQSTVGAVASGTTVFGLCALVTATTAICAIRTPR